MYVKNSLGGEYFVWTFLFDYVMYLNNIQYFHIFANVNIFRCIRERFQFIKRMLLTIHAEIKDV